MKITQEEDWNLWSIADNQKLRGKTGVLSLNTNVPIQLEYIGHFST